ncbi:PREDICTED: uncharacterized protein LOC109580479 [Amphimedon queenslandica]|uniref:Uncharacterized protein n=1 Tax=Amphimedon queenslandica TaxID=400682 RepID=A0A1X7VE13_AMPQE|nr:PREDICTED: uncharacterized protein LOC109580479 [Amphimedon queenslandica]|eukprot:XP_019849258.1 PREDICTED: uncharacterized protein LOC109580479 [Amphimedon queenslandica]
MVAWMSVMMVGKEVLPVTLAITGLFLISLFVVPLQSSFVKPGTPLDDGLILPRPIGLAYLLLISMLPGIIFSSINSVHMFSDFEDLFLCQLFFTGPVFVLSLLESQGIFLWFGNVSERTILLTRWGFGILAMAALSLYLNYVPASTDIPRLAVPLIFSFIALLSTLSSQGYDFRFIIGMVVLNVILVLTLALQLPWEVQYNFSLVSLPLWALQLLLVLLMIGSLVLLLGWQKDLTLLWPTYHAVFVGCEFIMNSEGIYSLSFLLITGFAAVLLCLRLHTVGRLPLPLTILCVCLHVLKLSHFLPDSTSFSTSSSFLSLFGLMLTAVSLLKLFSSESLSLKLLLSFSIVLAVGLVCSIQLLVVPLLISITHTPPTSSDLAAFIVLFVGILLQYFTPRLKSGKSSSLIVVKYLPPSLFFLATLLWLLQPEFNLFEINDAVSVVILHEVNVNKYLGRIVTSEQLSLLAWTVVMKWLVVLYSLMIVASVSFKLCFPELMLQAALSLFCGSASVLFSLQFGHHTPFSFLGILYGVSGLIGGFLLSLILLKKSGTPTWFEGLLLFLLTCLCMITLTCEWGSLPSHVNEPVSIPSASLFLLLFVSIAVVLKAKSLSGKPLLPFLCNASILIAFLIAVCLELPLKLEKALVVSLSSCLFLLLQSDGWIVSTKRVSNLFLAPSLVASSLTLFIISFFRIVDDLSIQMTIMTSLELICLFACIPGQVKFLYSLWKGLPLRLSVFKVLFYILPNAFLIQYGGSVNVVFGSTVVLAFSLLAVSEFQTFLVL